MIDAGAAVGARARTSPPIASSSRCCTASAAICRAGSSGTAIGVRVYVPFGREWFPYFMRRLGERPANVMFVVRGIIGEGDVTGSCGTVSYDRPSEPGHRLHAQLHPSYLAIGRSARLLNH